jgi:hypothetical protein
MYFMHDFYRKNFSEKKNWDLYGSKDSIENQ